MAQIHILGIPGSLRKNSYNKGLLRAAQQMPRPKSRSSI